MNREDNKEFFNNFLFRIKNENIKKLWLEDTHFREKFFDYVYQDIHNVDQLNILEFGVHAGYSTSLFLDVCKLNNGKLYSVDVNDYSKSFNDPNWTFIKSRDDNFDYIEKLIPNKVDVILIDTLHKANIEEKNFIGVGCFCYLFTIFTPLIPSGSFFSDYNISLFFINLSIMYASSKQLNIFNKR